MAGSCLQFNPEAFGSPADWNARSAYLTWNRRQAQNFAAMLYPATASERLADFYTFLDCRSDRARRPLSLNCAPPLQKESGWFRLPWLPSGGDAVAAVLEAEGWVRAWHGTKLEALYSHIFFGRLFSSSSSESSERLFTGAPDVYLHKDSTAHKAEHYTRFVQLSPSLQFFAIKWEVRTHRNYRVIAPKYTDQWVQQPNSVILVALWLCSRITLTWKVGLTWPRLGTRCWRQIHFGPSLLTRPLERNLSCCQAGREEHSICLWHSLLSVPAQQTSDPVSLWLRNPF